MPVRRQSGSNLFSRSRAVKGASQASALWKHIMVLSLGGARAGHLQEGPGSLGPGSPSPMSTANSTVPPTQKTQAGAGPSLLQWSTLPGLWPCLSSIPHEASGSPPQTSRTGVPSTPHSKSNQQMHQVCQLYFHPTGICMLMGIHSRQHDQQTNINK